MDRNRQVYHGMGCQIRDQDVLIRQIKSDYAECKDLWDQVQKGVIDICETEKIEQMIAWIKTGLAELKEIQVNTIEVVSWGEINNIENEILRIEEKIRIKIMGVLTDK